MPTYNLFAAVWKVKPTRTANLSLIQKGVAMETAMMQARNYLRGVAARVNAENPVFAFLAPEYYWVKNIGCEFYSEEEKTTIYSALRESSAGLNGLIILPGTVNWQVPKEAHVGTPPTKLGKKNYVGYSSTPAYLDGAPLLDYDKKYNDSIIDRSPDTAFGRRQPPEHSRQDFRAKNLHFGVDICGDLNKGQLQLTLGDRKVDTMALLSGFIDHRFNDAALLKIPVRDGGAFVHCDNTGLAQRNGLWIVDRGHGWHGSSRIEATLAFKDLDNVERKIGFVTNSDRVPGTTMKVSALGGFGPVKDLDAAVSVKSRGWVRKFAFAIPGGRLRQTATIEKDGGFYKVALSRTFSKTKNHRIKSVSESDTLGMQATGRGNVSKIGKIPPGPEDADLDCYTVPISK